MKFGFPNSKTTRCGPILRTQRIFGQSISVRGGVCYGQAELTLPPKQYQRAARPDYDKSSPKPAASGLAPLCRVAISAILLVSASAYAQDFPTRQIRVISPYPAGSASDTVTRVVVKCQGSQLIGQPMIIETKPGAGGSIGFGFVAKAEPVAITLRPAPQVDGNRKRAAQNPAL